MHKVRILIRGLRDGKDFEYENPISIINHKINPNLETFYISSRAEYNYISSTIIKEMGKYKREELQTLVPARFFRSLRDKFHYPD